MRILVLGATGMLGHKMVQELSASHNVFAACRNTNEFYKLGLNIGISDLFGFDAAGESVEDILRFLKVTKPDWVINCIGVIKQLKAADDPLVAIPINALFPHRLDEACRQHGARLIHVSTDCVFNGKKLAPYLENDIPDAQDMYGRTKLMGEVSSTPGITLRTSIIGRELKGTSGLVEWFLSQKGTIKGFSKALYTGFTTREFVNIVKLVIDQNLGPGLYQVSSDPISKYDLLSLVRKEFNLQTEIEINDSFVCDRRLDSSRFRKLTGHLPKSWPVMIAEMAADTSPYEKWRQ